MQVDTVVGAMLVDDEDDETDNVDKPGEIIVEMASKLTELKADSSH
jgi:hypothetical protein